MKKKLLIILLIVFIGMFIYTEVYAVEYDVFNKIIIDYTFSIDGNNDENLKFKLYDKSGELQFDSKVEKKDGNVYFVFYNSYDSGYNRWNCFDRHYYVCRGNTDIHQLPKFIKYYDEFDNFVGAYGSISTMQDVLNDYHLVGSCDHADCNYYDYVPMILEELSSHEKKIVFASLHLYLITGYPVYFPEIYLVNTLDSENNSVPFYYGDSFQYNVEFMRDAVYDYSDELWEELNNGPFASREMNLDSNSVVIGGSVANDLSKPSVIKFGKNSNTNQDTNQKETIVEKLTNPSTWSNGVVLLIILMILVIGTVTIFITKRRT